jgi:hypothetical protein
MEEKEIVKKKINLVCKNCWQQILPNQVFYIVSLDRENEESNTIEKNKDDKQKTYSFFKFWKNKDFIKTIEKQTENWIQCGLCYKLWQEELRNYENYNYEIITTNKERVIWWILGISINYSITKIFGITLADHEWNFKEFYNIVVFGLAGIITGWIINKIYRWVFPILISPIVPNRFRLRT